MTMLLQWPRFLRSPSRNQTPRVICWMVSGVASEFVTNKANPASAAKKEKIRKRLGIEPPTMQFTSAAGGMTHDVKIRISRRSNGSKAPPCGGSGRRGRCEGGRRLSDRRPVDDQYRYGGRDRHGEPGDGAGAG